MVQSFLVLAITLCLMTCHGLDITLNLEHGTGGGSRSPCGILTCEEMTNASVGSSTPVQDQDGLAVDDLHTIVSISVFKKSPRSAFSDSSSSRRNILLGSVTSQTPRLTRVGNGRKINGLLETGRAVLRVELVKQDDCQAEFSCQVRGLDLQGKQVVSTASLTQQQQQDHGAANQVCDDGGLKPAVSLQLLTSIQQLITQSVDLKDTVKSIEGKIGQQERDMKDRTTTFENRMEDKILQLQRDLIAMSDSFEHRIEHAIENSNKDINTRSDTFEHRLDARLNLFENRVESKVDSNNNMNKLMELDVKISTELAQFRSEVRADILDALDTTTHRLDAVQREALANFSESVGETLTNTSSTLLTSVASDLDLIKTYGHVSLATVKNDTRRIREMLTSGEVSTWCVMNETSTADVSKPQLIVCERGMGVGVNKGLPQYLMTTQPRLQRQVLCDTETDGGGWIVIQ
ncbi:hypothetical protein ElyMa_000413300, partial [Elysia marginata]